MLETKASKTIGIPHFVRDVRNNSSEDDRGSLTSFGMLETTVSKTVGIPHFVRDVRNNSFEDGRDPSLRSGFRNKEQT
jgi:hypothetical protein